MKAREGFFQIAGDLANNALTDAAVVRRIDDLREWFCDNLELPERFSKTNSKGYFHKETKGLSWFKPSATQHISKAFELKAILEDSGHDIEILKEQRVGYVVYEDRFQIVAEPFSDTKT